MPTATLGAGGPVVSRIGLGLAALGRPAYITSGREEDLPDRSVTGMRTRTFSMLDVLTRPGSGTSTRPVPTAGRRSSWPAGWPSAAMRT
jgi:hypothetical protein